jgi:flagellar assembly protein FliH
MAQKFLFDNEFVVEQAIADEAAGEADEDRTPPEPTYSAAELAQARADGSTEGHAAGLAEGRAETERLATQAIGQISERLSEIADTVRTHRDSVTHDATAVASAIIRKVAPDLIRRGALDSIEAAISGCLPDLTDEPRIVVRVHDDVLDAVQARIGPMVAGSGFSGDVVVIADPALEPSDCTVEWADGGIRHDPSRVWRDIEEILRTHLETPEAGAPPSNPVADPTEPAPETEAARAADGQN